MAVATKTARALQASATQTAGAANTNGTGLDLTTALGFACVGKVTNGATGPSVGCTFRLEVSNDGSDWFTWFEALAGTANSEVYEFPVDVPAAIMHVRSVFGGNTGQNVTIVCDGHEITSIA